jgi:hypothetical protein
MGYLRRIIVECSWDFARESVLAFEKLSRREWAVCDYLAVATEGGFRNEAPRARLRAESLCRELQTVRIVNGYSEGVPGTACCPDCVGAW